MSELKKIFRDVLYVSKLTKTNNKKLTIMFAVILSQLTAFTDVLIIILFTSYLADGTSNESFLTPLIDGILMYEYLFPVLVLLRFLFIYLQSLSIKNLELSVQKNLKVHMLREVFDKRNYSVSDAYFYINILSGHISFFYSNITIFLNSFLQIFAYAAYLFLSDSRTISTFSIGAVILFFPARLLIKKSKEYMHRTYEFSKIANDEVQRVVDNMFLIKLLKKDSYEIDRFRNTVDTQNHNEYNNHRYGTINAFLPTLITMFIFSLIIVYGNFSNTITLDFIGVTLRLFQSLGQVANATNKIINSHVHIEKFYEMDKNKLSLNKKNFTQDSKSQKAVNISNVDFKYFNSNEYIFRKINLEIEKNSHTILTGVNGSGKSTLLGLIAGVFYAEKGKVSTFSTNFGYIGATPLIFTGSLKENLLYGNNIDVDDKVLSSYLKEFKTFNEEGAYDLTRVVDNKSLSSGQMQKIAFIRALLSNVEILLLDESTANLDDSTRNLIFKILKEKNITIINSTHDPEKFLEVDSYLNIFIEDEIRSIDVKENL
jgi:ATP-binding cassette, subfamily B, bacterial